MLAIFTPDRIRRLTLALFGAAVWVSSAPLAAAPRITITVRVYQTAGLPSAIEEEALAETEALLQSALVDVRWRKCTGPANERHTTCDALPGPSELTLRILGAKALNQEKTDREQARPERSLLLWQRRKVQEVPPAAGSGG